jgi:tRNA pseudouridine55 synthase
VSRQAPGPGGLVIVDKPAGMTSHDVVARVRRLARTRRVGHGGTLDPMATGVLVVGVERATRLLTYVIGSTKRYSATIRLGQTTVTDDAEGEVTGGASAALVTEDRVRTELARLTGEIEQVPSAVSAIKVDGRRAYARVRAGEDVTLAARKVTVYRLDLGAFRPASSGPAGDGPAGDGPLDGPLDGLLDLDVDVECSSGTYIRAIARDLGATLGVGGHLTALRRTAVGAFTLAEAVPLDRLAELADPVTMPLPAAAARFFPRRDATPDEARVLGHGGPLKAVGMDGPYAVFGPDGDVIAVVSERGGRAKAEIVLSPSG